MKKFAKKEKIMDLLIFKKLNIGNRDILVSSRTATFVKQKQISVNERKDIEKTKDSN